MTPVRNEAWVLNAFLKATSLWADYIIIADQMSTDGSREIALSYEKVILINNDNPEFNEAERQKMLIDKAREIEGDKILFGLDADEIFAANFKDTDDWQAILNSKPGDVFWFKWAEICPNQKEYYDSTYYPWMFHDDGLEPHGNYVRNMHSMRIPYPIEEKQMYYVDDFRVLHMSRLNKLRCNSKARFYTFVDWENNKRSVVRLSRMYRGDSSVNKKRFQLYSFMVYKKTEYAFDLFDEVDTTSSKFYFDEYIVDRLSRYNTKKFSQLDIWDYELFRDYNLTDHRSFSVKVFHFYLRCTKNIAGSIIIRVVDKVLRFIFK